MEYSNWQLRKQIMSEPSMSISNRFHALVLIDNIDWTTGRKTFASKNHLLNWLTKVGEVNGLSSEDLNNALMALKDKGMAGMDGFTLFLSNDANG